MNVKNMDTEYERPSVMIVDDTPANLKLLKEMLNRLNYRVTAFTSGKAAVSSMRETIPNIILLDVSMPDMDGFEVCRQIKSNSHTQNIPVIFISALNEINDKVSAFRAGAVDYITKPFDFEEVRLRVNTHLKMYFYQAEIEKMNQMLSARVSEQVEKILDTERRLSYTQEAIITGLAKLSECRDTDTGDHVERVSTYCTEIAKIMARYAEYSQIITDDFIKSLRSAATLHDIGKVGIDDTILLKNGKLTDHEFEQMKKHTVIGGEIIEKIREKIKGNPLVDMAYDVTMYHHERWDGQGYPSRLRGDQIPLSAQIMAIADVYDALGSKRPYKDPFPQEMIFQTILDQKGLHFSPHVVDAFEEYVGALQ